MSRVASKWSPIGLGLLTVATICGCQTTGSRSVVSKKPDAVIEHAMQDAEAEPSEQPYHLAAASEPTGGTSIQGMPTRKDPAPARRGLFRSSSCSS